MVLVHTWSSLHPPLSRKQDCRQKLSPVVLTVRQRELEGQGKATSVVQGSVRVDNDKASRIYLNERKLQEIIKVTPLPCSCYQTNECMSKFKTILS